jgi:hypothetical protein
MTGPAAALAEPGPGPALPGTAGQATPGLGGQVPPGSGGPALQPPRGALRRWRAPLTVLALVLLGGIVIALLTPPRSTTGYLDPGNPGPQGTRALAAILAQRGLPVTRADSVAAARDAIQDSGRLAGPGGAPALVITNPYLLSPGQLGELTRLPANAIVVEPDSATLSALNREAARTAAPQVTVAGADAVRPVRPGCTLAAATVAGDAGLGGVLMRVSGSAAALCYRVDGHPTLVRYLAGGRTVTLLGSGVPLTNADLAHRGNAALALNLLRGSPRIVWLVPNPPVVTAAGQKSLLQVLPGPAYLVALQVFIAAGLAALWRTRRLGPLVAEPLPVVVRASETVEGHGRLYRSRRSRGRAAVVLRDAARLRITARLALPGDTDADAVCAAVAAQTGRGPDAVRAILYGPAPRDDAALVTLGQDIDALEGEVRTQ